MTIQSTVAVLWSLLLLAALLPSSVTGIMQTGSVDVSLRDGSTYTLLSSQASFGEVTAEGASSNKAHRLVMPPNDNQLLCQNITASQQKQASLEGSTILVPRGVCSFEFKAWIAQQLGASAIIVYGALASRYALNETKYINQTNPDYTVDDIVYPKDLYDYDCSKGIASIPASSIQMEPLPYNAAVNDPVLSGNSPANLCQANSEDHLDQCASKACLLTGKTEGDTMQACCAWDLHIWLYNDPKVGQVADVSIPATYVTLEQAQRLMDDYEADSQIYVTIYSRTRPNYNYSSIIIWMLGVFVAALAAHFSADDYHRIIRKVQRKQERRAKRDANANGEQSTANTSGEEQAVATNESSSPPVHMEESLELNLWHALGFVVMASSGLMVLFVFKIYKIIKVFYAIGCSKALSQIIFFPLCWRIGRRFQFRDRIVWRTRTEDFGDISILDIVSHVLGFTLGAAWLAINFLVRHPDDITFYWVMQDVFGAAMCISFLAVIKLNSLKVAALLLIVAFFYDIFFVFVTPLLFKGKSVMITVATSGGPPTADPAWCEKYPDDAGCQGGQPLPMLFQIPRIGDYQGGSSLLGLGDIVLPGLLLSFAARLDAAKSLLGVMGGGHGAINAYGSCPEERYCFGCKVCSGGYFWPSVIAYAVGLMMANMAVYLMNMGQPALLYLVPCCVGTMSFMAWRRNELYSLWEGPKAIRQVDKMLYGEYESENPSNEHMPVPLEDGQDAHSAPSAEDGVGDMALADRNVV